jgi:nucleoside diphosphate kinase
LTTSKLLFRHSEAYVSPAKSFSFAITKHLFGHTKAALWRRPVGQATSPAVASMGRIRLPFGHQTLKNAHHGIIISEI